MLTNATEMLKSAKDNKYAVCQFNINNLEWTRFILEECNINKAPVILGVSEGAAKYMGGYYTVFSLVNALIKDLQIEIPVVLHLDHGSNFENCKKAIDAGFTSVMIDASKHELSKNIEITKQVVEYAKKYNVSVEAEIGRVGGEEDGISSEIIYTDIEESKLFVKETQIDFLAPALGSVHGIYKGEPKLDFDRMKTISLESNLPLVLHGGSGIPDYQIKKAIECGIAKLNINTDLQLIWSKTVRKYLNENLNVYDPRKIIKSGETLMKEEIKNKNTLLGSYNRI